MSKVSRAIRVSAWATAFSCSTLAGAQSPNRITIRNVSAPLATRAFDGAVSQLREIADGRVLVNDSDKQTLTMFDATLQRATSLSDTHGAANTYPRFATLIAYSADSSLFYDAESRALVVIDPQGKFGRTMSLPYPPDFNSMTSGGFVSTDDNGHLIYQGRKSFGYTPPCRPANSPGSASRPPSAPTDSVVIIRADFETRTVDTVARSKTTVAGVVAPKTSMDANCNLVGAKIIVDPSVPASDSWTVTSRGMVAIVRSHDYHIDWIDPNGTKRSTAKMPFDWRRLSDKDKQAKIDSARKIIDSLTARGGYRMRVCAGGLSTSFNTNPPSGSTQQASVSVSGSASGTTDVAAPAARDPNECQSTVVTAQFAPLDSMADYIAPIREDAALADTDGNVWILPTTSSSARGGLLYDVVNTNGEIVERVQLPSGRAIAGFGRGGVLYLSKSEASGYVLEKVKVVR